MVKWLMWLFSFFNNNNIQQSVKGAKRVVNAVFTVSGHWRTQWVGSDRDGTRRKIRKWIDPFIKGDKSG
jgi:hypothetical protein